MICRFTFANMGWLARDTPITLEQTRDSLILAVLIIYQ